MKNRHNIKTGTVIRNIRHIMVTPVVAVLLSETAHAHKLIPGAWTEGDTPFAEGAFGNGSAAKNLPIPVYDKKGTRLSEGKTSETGEFSFKAPEKTDPKLVLRAGMYFDYRRKTAASE